MTRAREYTIDRDLELAITEFAPGAQKTKDKAIHTAIGFTAPLYQRGSRWVISSENPLPFRRWVQRCKACGHMMTSIGREPDNSCSHCGQPEDEDRLFFQFEIAVPQAFRSDLTRGEDAKEDENVSFGIPSALVEATDDLDWVQMDGTNCTKALSETGNVWRINDNAGRLFWGGITQTPPPGQRPELHHQWIDERYGNGGGADRIALAAGKTTEVLRIAPAGVPGGLTLNPASSNSAVRAAIFSAAFLLQRVLADGLDIDPDEIEIASIASRNIDDRTTVADIILSDRLANGAGFVREGYENLLEIVQKICQSPPTGLYVTQILSDSHIADCDSACYDCLKVYRNMTYHGLLDWRLAVTYLKLLLLPAYRAGLDGNFSGPELRGWLADAERLRSDFLSYFNYQPITSGQLPGFIAGSRRYLVVHPLWNTNNPEGILAEAVAASGGEIDGFIDTFNLLRRPGWCYALAARGH